jgi:transposase-like protein
MANPHAIPITLSADDRARLQGWVRRRKTGQALATRARVVLACAAPGSTNGGVAEVLGASRPTVALWRRRFAGRGLGGLPDEPRPGAPRKVTDERVERAVTATLEVAPADAADTLEHPLPGRGDGAGPGRGSAASGAPSPWSRTGRRPSGSPRARCSSRRCATSSGST